MQLAYHFCEAEIWPVFSRKKIPYYLTYFLPRPSRSQTSNKKKKTDLSKFKHDSVDWESGTSSHKKDKEPQSPYLQNIKK